MHMLKAKLNKLCICMIFIGVSILLISCGGGGSSSSTDTTNITINTTSTINSTTTEAGSKVLSVNTINTINEKNITINTSTQSNIINISTVQENALNNQIIFTGNLTPKMPLKITEISLDNTVNPWFEVYNPNTETINLRSHKLRSLSNQILSTEPYIFDLPDMDIPAYSYVIISAKHSARLNTGADVVLLKQGDIIPSWLGDGFIELLYQNKTVDIVHINKKHKSYTNEMGEIGEISEVFFNTSKVIDTKNFSLHKESIALWQNQWLAMNFATPAGMNDIPPDALDNDQDGIPSIAKQAGKTFGGIDIYAMGARQGQKDVFIQMDYMNDKISIPQKKALDKIKQAFSKHNIALHIDVGSLFNKQFNVDDYNLGQGKLFGVEPCVTLPSIYAEQATCKTVFDYKKHMQGMRRHFFHYVFLGTSQVAVGNGPSGMAEYLGKNSLITLYGWSLNTNSALNTNLLMNYQAGAIMHELGHNFGLLHGGGDNITYKPNYVSVMNYLYQLRGVNLDLNMQTAIDRFLNWRGYVNMDLCLLNNSPCNENFVVDYSHGLSLPINENYIIEAQMLTAYNNTTTNVFLDFNRDTTYNLQPYALDLNQDSQKTILQDFNDWQNLKFNTKMIASNLSPFIGVGLELGVHKTMH